MVTLCQWIPKFNWYMRRVVVENGHSKDTCHDNIGLCAYCIDIVVGSMVSTIGRVYVVVHEGKEQVFTSTS